MASLTTRYVSPIHYRSSPQFSTFLTILCHGYLFPAESALSNTTGSCPGSKNIVCTKLLTLCSRRAPRLRQSPSIYQRALTRRYAGPASAELSQNKPALAESNFVGFLRAFLTCFPYSKATFWLFVTNLSVRLLVSCTALSGRLRKVGDSLI